MSQASAQSPGRPLLVGRAREQALLREALDGALAGWGRLVLIGGEAGIGKTTLVEALAREARARGALVLSGGCYDLTTTPPYGPWIDLAVEYPEGDGLPALPEILRSSSDGGPQQDAAGSQGEIIESVRAFLATLAGHMPLLVVLEDLHWSDQASLELLRSIARRIAGLPLLLVVTYRSDEVTRLHPLHPMLPLLVRESDAVRVDPRRLDEAAVYVLLEARYALSSADETRLGAYLGAHAEGNPLFIRELLRALEDEQVLVPSGAGWSMGALTAIPVPSLLTQAIHLRLDRLGADARDLLAIAAVLGQEVALDAWGALSDMGEDVLLDLVERASGAGILVATSDGRTVRFSHALVREALYQGILPPRRRVRHREIGEYLSGAPRPDPDQVAYHFQQAGDERAIEWLVRAAERAHQHFAWSTAVERFEAAITLLEHDPNRSRERAWLLFRAGCLLYYGIDAPRGIAYFERAHALALAHADLVLAAYARFDCGSARATLMEVRKGMDDMREAIGSILALTETDHLVDMFRVDPWVVETAPPDLPAYRSANGTRNLPLGVTDRMEYFINWLALAGYFREVEATHATYAARVPTLASAPTHHPGSSHALGLAAAAFGRPEEARAWIAAARTGFQANGYFLQVGLVNVHDVQEVLLIYYPEQISERRRVAEAGVVAMEQSADARWEEESARHALLPLFAVEGDWSEAREIAVTMLSHAGAINRDIAAPVLGVIARHQGDAELAWSVVRDTFPHGSDTKPGDTYFVGYALVLQRVAVGLALDAGDLATARTWLEAHDRWLEWSDSVPGRSEGALLWARFHLASGDSEKAYEQAETALRLAGEPRQPLALLAAQRFLGELESAAQRYGEAGQYLLAVLTLTDACAAPFERALTLLALAELRLAEEKHDDARRFAGEARRICEPLDAKPTLTRADALLARLQRRAGGYPAGLTAREADVLRLIAQGLTDAEIAEQLFIAPRTVNTHVTSIYTKLNINTRAAATRLAIEHGLV